MAPYEGLLREVVLRMKQWTGEELAEVLGEIWAEHMAIKVAGLMPDIVVPVPLYWTRRWKRGFNSCDILARHLARQLGVPCWSRVLYRTRSTSQQMAQPNVTARQENVKRAFRTRGGEALKGKTIVLVDDVLTTGYTASEAASALRANKPESIHVAVLAHGH